MIVGLALHIVSVIIWIGGLFLAFVALKPGMLPIDAEARLAVWQHGFGRFLPWSWLCVVTLLLSGFAMVFLGFSGLTALPAHVRAMMALGVLTAGLYAYLLFLPWRGFRHAMLKFDWPTAETKIAQVRRVMGVTLVIGLAAAIVGAAGRYYG
jgi:uncharacterized membrane protein